MSDFNDTPMTVEEPISDYSASEMSDDLTAALIAEYGEPDKGGEPEEQTPDGENYPDEDFPEEDTEEDSDEEAEDEEPEDGDDSDDEDSDEESEEESEEDEADKEVQGVVESLQKQADACATFLAAKGIDYNALRDEYLADGKLSKANLKALADAGIDEELINGYIEGQQARFETYSQHVMAIAGGAEEYDKLCKWAAKHLSEKEIKHFDRAVDSNDVDEARFAVKGLMALREKAQGGSRPKLVHGKTSAPAKSVKGFRSLAEQAKAQADPRYEVDPEYTRKVDRRILASGY